VVIMALRWVHGGQACLGLACSRSAPMSACAFTSGHHNAHAAQQMDTHDARHLWLDSPSSEITYNSSFFLSPSSSSGGGSSPSPSPSPSPSSPSGDGGGGGGAGYRSFHTIFKVDKPEFLSALTFSSLALTISSYLAWSADTSFSNSFSAAEIAPPSP